VIRAPPSDHKEDPWSRRATNVSRARILDVALTLCARRDYARTSLHEIAAALDVTKAALYIGYPTTEGLKSPRRPAAEVTRV